MSTRAAILRDLCGNPYRAHPAFLDSVLTPQVLSLAHAAHEERTGVELDRDRLLILADALEEAGCEEEERCERCGGIGRILSQTGISTRECPDCHGTGTIPTALLDRDRLFVLSDALSEAGCESEEILGHLRSAEAHYRGCWCLSLLLGKD